MDLHHNMLQEHPEMFNRSSNAKGRISNTELGKRTFETWTGASRSEVPSFESMRQLLDQLGLNPTGHLYVVRRRFQRNVRRDRVFFSNQRWQVYDDLLYSKAIRKTTAVGSNTCADTTGLGDATPHMQNLTWHDKIDITCVSTSQGNVQGNDGNVLLSGCIAPVNENALHSQVNNQSAADGAGTSADISRGSFAQIITMPQTLLPVSQENVQATTLAMNVDGDDEQLIVQDDFGSNPSSWDEQAFNANQQWHLSSKV
jgi:hypothetical protein